MFNQLDYSFTSITAGVLSETTRQRLKDTTSPQIKPALRGQSGHCLSSRYGRPRSAAVYHSYAALGKWLDPSLKSHRSARAAFNAPQTTGETNKKAKKTKQ
jgi:hypothetical protein